MTVTKQDLVRQVSLLPANTIRKLLNYAELIMIPDEDLVSNVNMQQLVDKAHALADTYFPEWTDRGKSDFGEFLVELFALFSEKDFWYINAFANESILQKMRSYSNAYMKAISMGYTPNNVVASSMSAKISFDSGSSEKVEKGAIIISAGDKEFFNNESFTLASTDTSKTLTFVQGKHQTELYTFNGYNVFVRRNNIIVDSIELSIDGVNWNRVNNFVNATNDTLCYIVIPEEDGSVVIYFGTNGIGKTPEIGTSIEITYDTCNGADGNTDEVNVELISSATDRTATLESVISYPTGGSNSESLELLVSNAQAFSNNHGCVINEQIGEELLNSYDFVLKSKIKVIGFSMTYYVLPTNFVQATTSQKLYLTNNFEPRVLMGYSVSLAKNDYVSLLDRLGATAIRMKLYINRGYDTTSVSTQAIDVLKDYTDPMVKANYGSGFIKADVEATMKSEISGLQKVYFDIMIDGEYTDFNDVTILDTQLFTVIKSDDIKVETYVIN